ncbi:MAG: hypothetical protein QM756_12725 [Polyangiaceae bacterium]
MSIACVKRNLVLHRDRDESLSIVDVSTGGARPLPGYKGFEILDVSRDGELMALNSPWLIKGNANRTRLVVCRVDAPHEVAFETAAHLSYRAVFGPGCLLVEAHRRRPFTLALPSGDPQHEFEPKQLSLLYGALQGATYWYPHEKQALVFGLELQSGVTQTRKRLLDKHARIKQIAAAADGTLFCVFDDGSLARVTVDWQVAWRSSFPALAAQGTSVRFPCQLLVSDDGTRVCVGAHNPANDFGRLLVIDAHSGDVVNEIIPARGQGHLAATVAGRRVVTHSKNLIDLDTGTVTAL